MSNGSIVWHDLTIDNADEVRDFYKSVIGWEHVDHDMGEYNDYVLHAADDETAAGGVWHKRGTNAGMPSQWLMYVQVDSVAKSCEAVQRQGGTVVEGPRNMGDKPFAVIQDPAGATLAIIEA